MPSKPDRFGLELLHPLLSQDLLNERPRADIIFVHGLNGDPERTWHAKVNDGTDICWLSGSRFLPRVLPYSRIYTFKYNARVFQYRSNASIEDIAKNLLANIQAERAKDDEPPPKVIFICHSLGGLVVKQALVLNGLKPQLRAIQDATVGIVFLATPHGGSHLARTLAKMTTVLDSPKQIVETLTVGSSQLKNLNEEFAEYYQRRRNHSHELPPVSIASYGEMYRTSSRFPLLSAQVVPLDCAKTGLPGEDFAPVPKDHRSICRFDSPDDSVYQMICQVLLRWTRTRRLRSSTVQDLHPKYYYATCRIDRFVGRQSEIDYIKEKLASFGRTSGHSIAIYGFAFMGKTQLALRYAHLHDSIYQLIWMFNARSKRDLCVSIERLFDYLVAQNDPRLKRTGKEVSEKVEAVLKWLEEEQNCLIIYDDIDLTQPFNLRDFMPQRFAGHRILIGRQKKVADYAEASLNLRKMEPNDAVKMLLLRSDNDVPEDLGQASPDALKIVDALDRMPGFIEFAARYILHRSSVREYYRILMNQKENMRLGSPQGLLGDHFASYNLAFEALDPNSSSMIILKLAATLDGTNISRAMFRRAAQPAFRWSKSGHRMERPPSWSGVNDHLVSIFRDDEAFNDAITPLIDASFLYRENTPSGSVIQMPLPIQQFVRASLPREDDLDLLSSALAVVSHALPEDSKLEPNFAEMRTVLTPHVLRCLEDARRFDVSILGSILPRLTSMLLATLAQDGLELDYLDSLVEQYGDGAYRCAAAKWRAYQHFKNDKGKAEQILAAAQEREAMLAAQNGGPENARTNAAIGDLIIHRVQCLSGKDSGQNAAICEEILGSWSPLSNPPSPLEERTKVQVDTARAHKMFLQGEEKGGLLLLESLVRDQAGAQEPHAVIRASDYNWATVILSQIYCVQRRYADVVKLLRPKVENLLARGEVTSYITSDYRVLLCEAYLCQRDFYTAHTKLTALRDDLRLPGQVTNQRAQVVLMKVKSQIARGHHMQQKWAAAAEAWKEVLSGVGVQTEELLKTTHFDGQSIPRECRYMTAVAIYSLGVVCWFEGEKTKAQHYIRIADDGPREVPGGKIDYTGWYATVRKQHVEAAGRGVLGTAVRKLIC